MKLLIRRDQKTGLIGKNITFTLDCRAELTDEEQVHVKKYNMGRTLLFEKNTLVDRGSGLIGLISRLIFKARNVEITINDLANGKHVECKDIMEMKGIEEDIKVASENFKIILGMAAHFGGEELVEI